MKLKPLKQWICDYCGQVIEKPEDGWLEWKSDLAHGLGPHAFRIVHHKPHSPVGGCYYTDRMPRYPTNVSDDHLRQFVGPAGLLGLLDFFDARHWGVAANSADLAEIIRRLHVPGYEQKRLTPDED